MKLTCQNGTPALYPDDCATECPVPDTCTLNSMAQGGVIFSWLPGGKSCDCSTCDDVEPLCGRNTADEKK